MSAAVYWNDDDDYITACLTKGEAPKPPLGTIHSVTQNCRWCTHIQHGLPCSTSSCGCENAYSCRDDSWRPVDSLWSTPVMDARRFADRHGVDGWIAHLACVPGTADSTHHRFRVKGFVEAATPTARSSS